VARPVPIDLEPLTREHVALLPGFQCSRPYAEEVGDFLRDEALDEQETSQSATFVAVNGADDGIDAFVTLSATNFDTGRDEGRELREALGVSKRYIPAVMIDYIGVHDRLIGQSMGLRIFYWVRREVFKVSATVGVRFITLQVRAGNWGAYQRYWSADWGFQALPIKVGNASDRLAPDPAGERPVWLPPNKLITMYYDLYANFGAYWPRPEGLDDTLFERDERRPD
jgi:hypothetical protein